MALEEEWLRSRLRLCELRTEERPDCGETRVGHMQVTVNCQACPPPAYNRCSLLSSLSMYTQALMDAARRAPAGEGLPPRARNGALEGFAAALTESILQSAWHRWEVGESQRAQHCGQHEEDKAKTSSQITVPPEGAGHAPSVTQERKPPLETLWEAGGDEGMAVYDEDSLPSAVAHSALPSEGSIDYPSAPPTSPLLPETVRSPGGFSRSLKCGLANGFRPSPPPPTPKDAACSEQGSPVIGEDKADFMARLMRSLSLECTQDELSGTEVQKDGTTRSGRARAEITCLSDYADWLSAEIIEGLVTLTPEQSEEPGGVEISAESPGIQSHQTGPTSCSVEGDPNGGATRAAAESWAERVLEIAVLEAAAKQKEMQEGSGPSRAGPSVDVAPCRGTPTQRGHPDIGGSGMEGLEELAEELVAEALQQAGLCQQPDQEQDGRSENSLTPALEQRTQPCVEPQTLGRSRLPSLGPRPHLAPLPPRCSSFASDLAEKVLRSSTLEAAKLRRGPAGSRVRALLGSWNHSGSRALQGLLLWAAASHMETAVLQLTLTDAQLQTKFCSVARRAQLSGWTVGDLVTSVLRFCEQDERAVERRQSLTDLCLIECLQKQLGEAA